MITTSPAIYSGLQYAGAAFLAWLGVQSLRSTGAPPGAHERESAGSPALQGFAVAFLNPKLAIFFLALFSQFLDPGASVGDRALMVATMGGIDGVWYCSVAMLLSHPALLPRLQAARRRIDRVFGVILLALALRIVWQALASAA